MDAASWSSNNSLVAVSPGGYNGSSCTVTVSGFFSGTATIECYMLYSYYDTWTRRTIVDHVSSYYYITAKVTEISLNSTEINLEPGDEYELKYVASPSDVSLFPEWSTSDDKIASIENDYGSGKKIRGGNSVTITAKAVGTCTITCNGNTGGKVPTCIVRVEDNRPHLTADVPAGSVKAGTKVTLTCDMENADIRYTTNGDDPTKASQKYTVPIELTQSITLKAKAYVGELESKVLENDYKVVAHAVGDVFNYTTLEGVQLKMKAYLSGTSIYAQVGTGIEGETAVDRNYTGHITIPNSADGLSVNLVSQYAFDGCKLSSVSLGASDGVDSHAFRGCTNLLELSIPSLAKLLPWAFENCSSLRTVIFERSYYFTTTLPRLKNNASNIFAGCEAIRRVYMNSSASAVNSDVFPEQVYSNATLYVDKDRLEDYKKTNGWKEFANIETNEDVRQRQVQLTTSLLGNFGVSSGDKVMLSSSNAADADIYYTLDGTNPSKSATKYTPSGITIANNCVLKAIAYKSGYEDSNILIAGVYLIRQKTTPLERKIKQLAANTFHTMMVMDDGSLWACGSNSYGKFGNGTTTSSQSLIKIMDDVMLT